MEIRDAALNDSDSITEIHLRSFNRFFLSSLGKRFLKTFYKACISNPDCAAVVCRAHSGELTGFAVGASKPDGFYKRLIVKNLPAFSLEALILLFTKPKALLRLALNLTKTGEDDDSAEMAELLSIATLPEFKGAGIGKQLIAAFETRLKERNCKAVSLTTDFYDNDDAIGFYQKCGYVIKNDFMAYPNRRMYKMIKYI